MAAFACLSQDAEYDEAKSRVQTLNTQRLALEMEAEAIHDELTSPGINGEPPAGVKDSLIDSEGYPRGDVDIYNVKAKRKRLSEINTDHKAIMKILQGALITLHDTAVFGKKLQDGMSSTTPSIVVPLVALAELNQILEGSPADTAGIKERDLLMKFGHIDSSTMNAMTEIIKLVQQSVGSRISLSIKRGQDSISLVIVPATWGGRGLLGCHLSPTTTK